MNVRIWALAMCLLLPAMGRAAELDAGQKLIVACYHVDVAAVVRSLREGADVNSRFGTSDAADDPLEHEWEAYSSLGSNRWTPLIALASACKYPPPPKDKGAVWKDPDLAKRLRAKVTRNQLRERQRNVIEILNILLSHGCDIEADDGFGATALFKAVERDDLEIARTLLRFKAQVNKPTRAYIDGPSDFTPLHAASESAEMYQLLLDHGANPELKDSEGQTPAELRERAKKYGK
jgi:ankyrin repeat protein